MSFLDLKNHKLSDEYSVNQIRGQLIATLNTGYHPKRGCEVFLNNIPRDLLLQEIHHLMKNAGRVYQIRMLMDFSGFNRGNAYVTYIDTESAKRAIIVLDQEEIRPNWPVPVQMSYDNNRLVMKNIPDSKNHNDIIAEIAGVIGEGLKDVIMVKKEHMTSQNNCILRYDTHRHALEARKKLWPGIDLWDTAIDVDWAMPPELISSKPLFFQNCPEDTTKFDFFAILKSLLDLKEVTKLNLKNGSGSIVFANDKARRKAFSIMKGCLIRGRELQISLTNVFTDVEAQPHENIKHSLGTCSTPVNTLQIYSAGYSVPEETPDFQNKTFLQPVSDSLSFYPNDSIGFEVVPHQHFGYLDAMPTLPTVQQPFQQGSVFNDLNHLKSIFPSIQTFYPQPQYTPAGLFNVSMAIQQSIHSIVNFDHPNVTWISWGPNDEIPNYISAVRILPVVNNCCYEFVLLQVLKN